MKLKLKKYKDLYFSDYFDKNISITFISFAFNLCLGFGKLLLGIISSSYWFIITAGYYITLSITKGHLLYSYSKIQHIENLHENYKQQFAIYHRSGYFLIVLGVSYLILCIWMYCYNQQSTYPEYILYGVVAIAFYKIGNAIYGLSKVKSKGSPILNVIKIISMIDACVSIVAVQCALLAMRLSEYASSSSALFGMAFSVMFMITGGLMILKKERRVLD